LSNAENPSNDPVTAAGRGCGRREYFIITTESGAVGWFVLDGSGALGLRCSRARRGEGARRHRRGAGLIND
jgi:hypothetical protein